jgi:hypothetical protein
MAPVPPFPQQPRCHLPRLGPEEGLARATVRLCCATCLPSDRDQYPAWCRSSASANSFAIVSGLPPVFFTLLAQVSRNGLADVFQTASCSAVMGKLRGPALLSVLPSQHVRNRPKVRRICRPIRWCNDHHSGCAAWKFGASQSGAASKCYSGYGLSIITLLRGLDIFD